MSVMIASRATIQCQQCGGAASPVPGREYMQCDYCRSLMFTTENPLTVDRITTMGSHLENSDCPVCHTALSTGRIEGRPVLFCEECYGFLLRNDDFGAIVRERRARRKGCEEQVCRPLNTDEYNRRICCPNCSRLMEVHPYYGPGNIIIDSCQACQYVWLDHGELRTVERSEGGSESQPLPVHVDEDGQLTIIPPASPLPGDDRSCDSPMSRIADIIFGY